MMSMDITSPEFYFQGMSSGLRSVNNTRGHMDKVYEKNTILNGGI